MNEQEEIYISQFKPFKQLIRVFKISKEDEKGKTKKQEWFDGILVGVTSRGLLINPISDYGESMDVLAASFIAFPQYRNNNVSFMIKQEF